MAYASVSGVLGTPPIANFGLMDSTPKAVLGTIINAVDLYWGGAEFIYLQMPASQAVKVGGVLAYDTASAFLASLVANTANLGKPVAFSLNNVASSAAAQYGWALISGAFPCWSNATIAANNPLGIVAAGQAGVNSAGKQINNARVTLPATTTVVKTGCTNTIGLPIIQAPNTDGWFIGMAVSGTGIPASSVITGIAQDSKTVTINNNTTLVVSSVTGTYNDATNFWNVVVSARPFAQGAIT